MFLLFLSFLKDAATSPSFIGGQVLELTRWRATLEGEDGLFSGRFDLHWVTDVRFC